MKIGIIGSGNIGSAIARHWVEAGHEVVVSAKHQENAERLAKKLGKHARAATPEEAARQGEVVLLSIPLKDVPALSPEVKSALKGKVVLDTCNPYPERDGESANEIIRSGQGTGVWTAQQLPGARVVRAFNSVHAKTFETQSRRPGDPVGVPLASDDADALRTAEQLVRDAGFGPVIVGGLSTAKRFDNGTPTYGSGASDKELRDRLDVKKIAAA
jgi:predicted dinucleotide-binding enzyme